MRASSLALVALLFTLALCKNNIHVTEDGAASQEYLVGVGKADVTGPAAEVGMMGYAMPGQKTAGIHTRLWARAFVISHASTGGLVAYVSTDVCMIMQAVKLTVITELEAIFGPSVFTNDNVVLSGIHTHSGPGGFSWYALYDISDMGYDDQNFQAVVKGIVAAIVKAHSNMQPSSIFVNPENPLLDSNINRSPTSYLANPAEERALYPEGDTDKNMTLVKFVNGNGDGVGSIAWFPVHCTSMNNSNHLISSDNKGYASYLFEKHMVGDNTSVLFRDIPFVAAFGQANEGDVSPNTKGPHCPDGTPCAGAESTCNGKNEQCIAPGPGVDMFDSTKIIGTNQFNKAVELFSTAETSITGPINFRHMFVNMSSYVVSGNFTFNGLPNTTCRAAMGYSFAAGTTDGPGAFDFTQGDNNSSNPFWNYISHFLAKPTASQIACQAPKPILLDVGEIKPIPWAPDVVAVQIVTIGQLVIVAVPGEFTTMSGRRMKNTVREVFIKGGMKDPIVVISGLSNTYSGYIATFEEYQRQRYEAASTIFGPHTLAAYQEIYSYLAEAIVSNQTVPTGATPRNLSDHQISFHPGVIIDTVPIGKSFGSVYQDVEAVYQVGENVEVVFYGANPRNNLMTGDTFLLVEQYNSVTTNWNTILTDADWDTRFYWKRHEISESLITVTWNISTTVDAGKYRISHFGYAKENAISSKVTPYSGSSSVFAVSS